MTTKKSLPGAPGRDRSITLANWQDAPANRWAFAHVREIMTTAQISHGSYTEPLDHGPAIDLASLEVEHGGETMDGAGAIEASYTDGLIVLHRGRIVLEHYADTMVPSRTHILNSVSKSITSSLAGILADEGRADLSSPVTDYVPEFAHSGFDGCTVQQLLDMRAGVRFSEDYADLDSDVRRYEQAAGVRPLTDPDLPASLYDYMPDLGRRGPHGEAFDYQSILTDALSWVLERAGGATFAELVASRIWSRMGAEFDAEVTVDAGGCALADGGVCTTLRDLARFGLLQLRDGRVGDHTVIPPSWVHESTRASDDLLEAFRPKAATRGYERYAMYHNCWWVLDPERRVWAGLGIYGQFLHLDATRDLVVAKFSSWPTALDRHLGDLHYALVASITAAVTPD